MPLAVDTASKALRINSMISCTLNVRKALEFDIVTFSKSIESMVCMLGHDSQIKDIRRLFLSQSKYLVQQPPSAV